VKSSKDDEATHNFQETRKYMEKLKSPDAFLSSMFHRFAMYLFMTKGKFKLYYEHALSFMNYTLPSEIQQKEQMEILENMGITTLCSPEIYNFSQLLEQPLLMSLKESPQKWLYDLLEIFMRGDVKTYDEVINSATTYHVRVN
jgi:26S proteasome regulatory subunit N9